MSVSHFSRRVITRHTIRVFIFSLLSRKAWTRRPFRPHQIGKRRPTRVLRKASYSLPKRTRRLQFQGAHRRCLDSLSTGFHGDATLGLENRIPAVWILIPRYQSFISTVCQELYSHVVTDLERCTRFIIPCFGLPTSESNSKSHAVKVSHCCGLSKSCSNTTLGASTTSCCIQVLCQ